MLRACEWRVGGGGFSRSRCVVWAQAAVLTATRRVGIWARESGSAGSHRERNDTGRREPRRGNVDGKEGERAEDHRSVPIQFTCVLLRRRVAADDAHRLGETVEFCNDGAGEVSR